MLALSNLVNLLQKKVERTKIDSLNQIRIEAMKASNGSTQNNSQKEQSKSSQYDSKTGTTRIFSPSPTKNFDLGFVEEKTKESIETELAAKRIFDVLAKKTKMQKRSFWERLRCLQQTLSHQSGEQIFDKEDLESFYIEKLERMRDEGRMEGDEIIEAKIKEEINSLSSSVLGHDTINEYCKKLDQPGIEISDMQTSLIFDDQEECEQYMEAGNSAIFKNSQLDDSDMQFFDQNRTLNEQ